MADTLYCISAATLQDITNAIRELKGISGYIPIDKLAEALAGKNVSTTNSVPLASRSVIRRQTLVDIANIVRARDGYPHDIRVSSLAAKIRGQEEPAVLKCVYYGAAAKPQMYDGEFVMSLTEHIGSGKLTSFNVNADADKYIYYAVPAYVTGFGECRFNVNGFWGGFILESTVVFTSPLSTYPESYYIYRSEHNGLGDTHVTVE